MSRVPATALTLVVILGACRQAGPSGPPSVDPTSPAIASALATPTAIIPSPSPPPIATGPTGAIAFLRPETPADGSQVDIYVVDAAGGEPTRLTNDPGEELDLYWTADGSRLVYTWHEPGPEGGYGTYHQTLASVRPDGTDRRDLGPAGAPFDPPAISPDRRFVAFSGDGSEDGTSGIVLLDLIDGTRRQLTTRGEVVDVPDAGPADALWSPDGTRILAYLPSRRVVIIDVKTGAELARIGDAGVSWVIGWTPDGKSVIYHSCGPELDKDECIAATHLAADLDGSHVRPYTGPLPPATSETSLTSPDGRWVASWANWRLRVAPSTGGTGLQLAAGGGAAWSPDSAWLVFSANVAVPGTSVDAFSSALFVIHRDGGSPIQLTDGPDDTSPAWGPN